MGRNILYHTLCQSVRNKNLHVHLLSLQQITRDHLLSRPAQQIKCSWGLNKGSVIAEERAKAFLASLDGKVDTLAGTLACMQIKLCHVHIFYARRCA